MYSDEVFGSVAAQPAGEPVGFDRPAQLAWPAIPLTDLFAKKPILFRIEVGRGVRWRSLLMESLDYSII